MIFKLGQRVLLKATKTGHLSQSEAYTIPSRILAINKKSRNNCLFIYPNGYLLSSYSINTNDPSIVFYKNIDVYFAKSSRPEDYCRVIWCSESLIKEALI